jgi:hypothetical protein
MSLWAPIWEWLFAIALSLPMFLSRERVNIPAGANALTKRCFKSGRPVVLPQQVAERFLRQGLKNNPPVAREKRDCLPGLIIEYNTFSRHCPLR